MKPCQHTSIFVACTVSFIMQTWTLASRKRMNCTRPIGNKKVHPRSFRQYLILKKVCRCDILLGSVVSSSKERKEIKQCLCISRIFEVLYRSCQMLSGMILILKAQIKNKIWNRIFVSPLVLSYKGSYRSEALLGPDVAYIGDSYHTRSN